MTQNKALSITQNKILNTALQTLEAGQALINRSYLSQLPNYPIASKDSKALAFNLASDMRVFSIERIVQNNKQSVLESTTAAYTALGAAGFSVFLFLNSDGKETNLYIGTRGESGKMLGQNSGELLRETFKGHFPGSSLQSLNLQDTKLLLDGLSSEKDNPSASVTAVTGVPALSTDNREHFMQGLECFIDAAEGRRYQALILAEPVLSENLDIIRTGYEQVATQLSPLVKQQLSYGEQDSDSVGLSISQNISTSLGESLGLTETRGTTDTKGTSTTETKGTSLSQSKQTTSGKIASLIPFTGSLFAEQNTTGTSESSSLGSSESHSINHSDSTSKTNTNTETKGTTDTESLNKTLGSNKQLSIEKTDKTIEQLLNRIDHHLERIDEAKTYGGWNSAAYFIGDGKASSESLASIFLGLIRGNKSSHEDFALTTWTSKDKSSVLDWLTCLSHPQLKPNFSKQVPVSFVTPATLVSGKEMAIQLSLPRRSTSTVAVVETQAFGRKVQRLDGQSESQENIRKISLGNLRHLWENLPQTIDLDMDQLSSHVFISGSTGAGKSNTLYEILRQLSDKKVPFLVIEPAKGEYKHVFGHRDDVTVLGTHPSHSELLRINPFRFPPAIHVLEHVDRLVEIFNVCWPMYAAMPAVLKEAILEAYQHCGWDLDTSCNDHNEGLFPTFIDVLDSLDQVINASAYSQEMKGNYIGALSTRIKSLTNGLNGQIFSANEIDNEQLFNSNVIIDLSRIGSSETKSLLMGVLVMRLSEHRMAVGGMNQPLQHVTVLEEAHHILKRSPEGNAEGSGMEGKAVEMLTNAIAEMRTYGEGFIIADQSPNMVDMAAIRNTNTKIIMRLPDESDRQLLGRSVALNDNQLSEIARLPKGVAIIYQNDWLEPVLCQVKKFSGEEKKYHYKRNLENETSRLAFNTELLVFLLQKRVTSRAILQFDYDLLLKGTSRLPLNALSRGCLIESIKSHATDKPIDLLEQVHFQHLASLVVDALGCRQKVYQFIQQSNSYEELSTLLQGYIQCATYNFSPEHVLATQHCLMKDYSIRGDSQLKTYSKWHSSITKEEGL